MSARKPPENPQEALARAWRHALTAAAESVAALHALLDAASLAGAGRPAATHAALAPLARLLDELAHGLDPRDAGEQASLLAEVIDALGDEIDRWEARARDDPDARAVLRTLLGLREILWEIGVRPDARADRPRTRPARPREAPGARGRATRE